MSRPTGARTSPGPAIGDGFTLLSAGDLISTRPLSPRLAYDAAFGEVARLLGGASLAVGNMETAIVDMRTFGGHPRTVDDWCMSALPAVAGDLADLGFRLVSRANNHCCDWGIEGMRETGRHLDAAGIVHAGAGETLAHARAPRYVETEHGRVGLVSAYAAQKWDNDAALGQFGEVPARTRSSEYSPLIGSTFLNSSGYHCHSCRAGTQRNACTNAWSRRVPSPSTHP
jgi:hypothetical protein